VAGQAHFPERLSSELTRRAADEQRAKRLPSLVAAVVRDGEVIWETAIGAADLEADRSTTVDTQYRLGSITKTLTASAVMQLRDAGRLDIEEPLTRYVEEAAHAPTIRQLLSHMSGLQRETQEFPWVFGRFASTEELIETLDQAERVLPPGSRFHYSNLGYSLLGVLVERVSGQAYADYIDEQLLRPLELTRTSFVPDAEAAKGYLVQHHAERVWTGDTHSEAGARAAAGALWGTVGDLCRWAAFLADPQESILAADTVREMRALQGIADDVNWSWGYGLGLSLQRDGARVLIGHGGGLPGFIAGVLVSPDDRIGAAVLTNSGGSSLTPFLSSLIRDTIEHLPVTAPPWRLDDPPPDDIAPLLGVWFVQATELVFRWRDERLEARYTSAPDWQPPTVLRHESDGRWRAISGSEQGELLTFEGDRVIFGGYPVTREPAFWD